MHRFAAGTIHDSPFRELEGLRVEAHGGFDIANRTRLRPLGSYHVLPTSTWMDPPSTGDLRLWGAQAGDGYAVIQELTARGSQHGSFAGNVDVASSHNETYGGLRSASTRSVCRLIVI
jgi:hypothetical protein